jgi:catechol 2,3-dioxygenase-like lactoylglutathione lyase family enzyme
MTATLTMAPAQAVRFHLSLNVSDLGRAVGFYRTLFGVEPAKVRGDYAKFEVADPPLVLSLEPTPRGSGGALNHLGFRMPDATALVAMQERLERAGIRSQREEGVECCYARQTKFWVYDPDRTLWEIYTLDGDIDHRGAGQLPEKVVPPERAAGTPASEPVVWEHRLGSDVPERAPFADGGVAEVRLRGSLNVPLDQRERTRLLDEARRVLRPGGRLFVHVLTAEKPFAGEPGLPGPAAAVRHVPVDAEVVSLVEAAGFEGVRLLKFDASPCFVRDGVAMRETQLEAWAPAQDRRPAVTVVYKGPFREVRDDLGNVFGRGRRVRIDAVTAERLRAPEWAGQFLILG